MLRFPVPFPIGRPPAAKRQLARHNGRRRCSSRHRARSFDAGSSGEDLYVEVLRDGADDARRGHRARVVLPPGCFAVSTQHGTDVVAEDGSTVMHHAPDERTGKGSFSLIGQIDGSTLSSILNG